MVTFKGVALVGSKTKAFPRCSCGPQTASSVCVCCLLLVEFVAALADLSLWEPYFPPWPLLALGQRMQAQLEEHTY